MALTEVYLGKVYRNTMCSSFDIEWWELHHGNIKAVLSLLQFGNKNDMKLHYMTFPHMTNIQILFLTIYLIP